MTLSSKAQWIDEYDQWLMEMLIHFGTDKSFTYQDVIDKTNNTLHMGLARKDRFIIQLDRKVHVGGRYQLSENLLQYIKVRYGK